MISSTSKQRERERRAERKWCMQMIASELSVPTLRAPPLRRRAPSKYLSRKLFHFSLRNLIASAPKLRPVQASERASHFRPSRCDNWAKLSSAKGAQLIVGNKRASGKVVSVDSELRGDSLFGVCSGAKKSRRRFWANAFRRRAKGELQNQLRCSFAYHFRRFPLERPERGADNSMIDRRPVESKRKRASFSCEQ